MAVPAIEAPLPSPRTRDADRSRVAILDAAETLFSERDYEAASLHEIAAAAGLSRGTPSYFFGSKDRLYRAVLDRVFAARHAAVDPAFAELRAWIVGTGGPDELRAALVEATRTYMGFLLGRPGFSRLLLREELAGGTRLRARGETSTAALAAFTALRELAGHRGVRPFDVQQAVLAFTVLTFGPVSYRETLMRAVERDLDDPGVLRAHVELVADQMMRLLTEAPR